MLDQLFTPVSFRKIFEVENRKGFDVAGAFFPSLEIHTLTIRAKMEEIRKLKSEEQSFEHAVFLSKIASLYAERDALKELKSKAIDDLLNSVANNVSRSDFKIALTQQIGPGGKPVFCIDNSPESFFVSKQIQNNIKALYGVKPGNRHELVERLYHALKSEFPLEIVKTDISSFYETIPRLRLIRRLEADQLLSLASKKFIKQILDAYGSAAASPQLGIPRGVGISAYLSELYLRVLDREIRSMDGLILYCRYVDDIVAVFARPPSGGPISYEADIVWAIHELGLSYNPAKTQSYKSGKGCSFSFSYLGYFFRSNLGVLELALSPRKLKKYKLRLKASFDRYFKDASRNQRAAYRDLKSRIRFLTSNTQLVNNKRHVCTGIFYSNSLLTDFSAIRALDKLLAISVQKLSSARLKTSIEQFSFQKGFEERRYSTFSTRELRNVVGAWRHDD